MPFPGNPRVADHPIADLFIDRWSPRAFQPVEMPEEDLLRCFEAARWAPSSYNSQPWRFVYARRNTPHFARFLGLLVERNQMWAANCSALVLLAARTVMRPPGRSEDVPSHSASMDSGAGWANFALQAHLLGYITHGMVGFDMDRARAELHIPADCRVEQMFAVGRQGEKSALPEMFQGMEAPNARVPLAQTVFEAEMPQG